MSIEKNLFGLMPSGEEVYIYTLKNDNDMQVKISTYGGTVVSLITCDKSGELHDVVLGYDSLENYLKGDKYFGAIVGRCANRIEFGTFKLNTKEYKLATNNGPNHLHGGIKGFDKVLWNAEIIEDKDNILQLSYFSVDGEEGYPGNLNVKVKYILTKDNSLEIHYEAISDKDTIVNLTNHSYFNLCGHSSGDILNHKLMINADRFTVNDEHSIPTGEVKNVDGTPMDFRTLTPIGKNINDNYDQLIFGNGYDHNWVLNTTHSSLTQAAKVVSEITGIVLDVYTTKPGVQFYSANFLDGSDIGKNGAIYNMRNALCLETQCFPNAINCNNFKSPILKAGEEYKHITIYKFSTL